MKIQIFIILIILFPVTSISGQETVNQSFSNEHQLLDDITLQVTYSTTLIPSHLLLEVYLIVLNNPNDKIILVKTMTAEIYSYSSLGDDYHRDTIIDEFSSEIEGVHPGYFVTIDSAYNTILDIIDRATPPNNYYVIIFFDMLSKTNKEEGYHKNAFSNTIYLTDGNIGTDVNETPIQLLWFVMAIPIVILLKKKINP